MTERSTRIADLVVPGVWWLHETRGSNVYLVEASDGQLLLIDCGFASSADGIIAELEQIAPGRGLDQLLLTHSHVDHSGAAMELRERLGATVAVGRGDCTADGRGGYVLHEPLGRYVNPLDPASWGKVPRNAACPCGSTRKFKHCHGRAA